MNLFTIGLAILSLTQIPGTNSQLDSFACKRAIAIVQSSPGRQCLMQHDNATACMAIIKNDTTITHEINDELTQSMDMCKEDVKRENTQALRDRLVQQQKEDKELCNRPNLNKNDAYSCSEMEKDIQDLDERLQKRKISKKSTSQQRNI